MVIPTHRTVLFIHRAQVDQPTGIHRLAFDLAEALAKDPGDHAIEICSGKGRGPVPDIGVPFIDTRLPRPALHAAWTAFTRPSIERLIGGIDLLHVTLPTFPVRSRAPQVITVHDLLPIHHPEWYSRSARFVFERSMRFHLGVVRRVITPSQVVADDLTSTMGFPSDRIDVVHHGIHPRIEAPVDATHARSVQERFGVAGQPYLMALGTVSARKNLDVLFRALAELRASGAPVPALLVVGGDSSETEAIRAVPASLGVAAAVRFTGHVSDAEVVALLRSARALLHPSHFEGFGFTPVEAMRVGVPAIVSNGGSLPEVVGDAAVILDPDDATAWAAAIERIVTDDDHAADLSRRGRAHASLFTWERAAALTRASYDKALDASR